MNGHKIVKQSKMYTFDDHLDNIFDDYDWAIAKFNLNCCS